MKKIKKIFQLYKIDWKRIGKNPVALFLVIALMILPSLYAWFNIKALWDPYGNTKDLPIAVYSADEGAKLKETQIHIGEEVIENLRKNDQLGWRFVSSKEQVTKGVQSGKYYAGIYLPPEFSEDLLSFIKGDIKKPAINYYFNGKINAIAPKITEKGATSVQEEISRQFIETTSGTLLEVFNAIGYTLEDNLVSINKVKNLILTTNDNLAKIDGYTQEVVHLQKAMPSLKQKLEKANQMVDYLPEVDALTTKIIALNDKFPSIQKEAGIILTLQDKIPEIKQASQQVAMIDEDFSKIAQTITEGVTEGKEALEIVQQVQDLLPMVQQFGQDSSNFVAKTQEAATKLQQALPQIQKIVAFNFEALGSVSARINSIAQDLQAYLSQPETGLTPEEKAAILQILQVANTTIDEQLRLIDGLSQWLTQINQEQKFDTVIAQLADVRRRLQDLQQLNQFLITNSDAISKESLLAHVNKIEAVSGTINQIIASIDVANITEMINRTLSEEVLPALANVQQLLDKGSQIDLTKLLNATQTTITNAVSLLEKYEKELPAIGEEIHDANQMLSTHLDTIVNGINRGADLYKNDLPVLGEKLQIAADFSQNEWPVIKKEMTSTLTMVNQKMPSVEAALNEGVRLINEDWPTIQKGIQKAAKAIEKGESMVDLGDIIQLLKADALSESDFMANPLELKTKEYYPIGNNGSASTPFYTTLCLWVGALLLSSLAATAFHLDEEEKAKYTKRETFVARMLTFLTIAIPQAFIVTLGNLWALGVAVANPLASVLFAVLIALTFMMMIYVFVGLFGNIGKGIGIIILVLSISGGGGNYPIQVSGPFFQWINPFLPFTYGVNLLREAAGGIYWPNAWIDIVVLISLLIVFAIVGTWAFPKVEPLTEKIEKRARESHFFH